MSTSATATLAPSFGYRAFSAISFDELLDQHVEHPAELSLHDCLDLVMRDGRLLLQASAGAGKSTLARRLLDTVDREGIRTASRGVLLDLRIVDVPQSGSTDELAEHLLTLAGLADSRISQPKTVLVLDGLNEANRTLAQPLLEAAELLASGNPWLGVLVTDRLSRRELPSRRWKIAGLTSTTNDDIIAAVGTLPTVGLALLRSPFFLDRVNPEDPETGRSALFSEELATVLPEQGKADALAEVALAAYETLRQPLLTLDSVRAAIGDVSTEDLLASGILLEPINGERGRFQHQLWHDYLAARALADEPSKWTAPAFNALTLRSSSADALVLLLEQCPSELVDDLLRRVYDWNLYAAAHLLANSDEAAPATSGAMLALLGERRFDAVLPTSVQAADALRLIPGELSGLYLQAKSPEDVRATAITQLPNDAAYQAWVRLFASDDALWVLSRLEDADPLDGWTAANVLRRCVTPDLADDVVALAGSADTVIGWRAVHVLGALRGGTLEALFGILTDAAANEHVRFGALRSYIEQSSRTPDPAVRIQALQRLAAVALELVVDVRLGRELERALVLVDPPAGWADAVTPVIETLLLASPDEVEHQRWETVGRRVVGRQS
ncbi:hypothetical protein acdb102_15910 [Acidothermaceae bacterium B102]|nr:hypothetical protein acdb102_15910 [Acidothermaceae bacterium B102]